MPPSRTQSHEYCGINPIQQASKNCRKNNVKLPGERPICRRCRRLSLACQWNGASKSTLNISNIADSAESGIDRGTIVYDNGLLERVGKIESKLDELTNTLNAFLPALASQANSDSSVTSWRNDSYNAEIRDDPASPARTTMDTLDTQASKYRALPPPQVISSVVDIYFDRVQNQPYSFFHERNFRQRLADGMLPDHLKFAVLAAALRFSDDEYYNGEYLEATAAYARKSWTLLVAHWFAAEIDPDIYICQSITLLAIIDFTAGRRHPGWLKIGMAVRIAQDLCLMMEPDSSLSYADQEERRRVFWSIYLLDKFCSCGRTRPAAITDAQCRVQLPSDEVTFENGEWKKTPTLDELLSTGSSEKNHPGYQGLLILTASIISRCARYCIYSRSKGEIRLPPWDSRSDFTKVHSMLLQVETKYDIGGRIGDIITRDCLQNNVINMQLACPLVLSHAIFHTSQCLLHHPLLLHQQLQRTDVRAPPSFLIRASQTCREHACAISGLLQEAKSAGCDVYYSFLGYCATVSGGIHSLFLNDADANIQQQALDCLQTNTTFLGELSRHWKNGKVMSSLLQDLAVESISSTSLAASSPQPEDLDAKILRNLWASVDTTTLSQPVKPIASSIGCDTRFIGFNSLLDVDARDLSNFDTNDPSFAPVSHLNRLSPNPSLALDGMSPFMSFFTGSPMNFGG